MMKGSMKRIKKGAALLTCVILLLMSLTGCKGDSADDQEETGQASDKIQIGMSFDSFVIERWQRDRDVFVATAR